jgi:DNA-binding NarL/FixJ family response regulator
MSIRIAIVEDDPAVQRGLVATLAQAPGYALSWLCADLASARRRLHEPFELMLLDLGLPDGRGIDLLPDLRGARPQARVVAFTVFDDEAHVLEAVEAGVDGYALKTVDVESLVDTLDSAMRGESPISPVVAGFLLRRLRRSERRASGTQASAAPIDRVMALTPRERSVLEALARGLSYREAAASIGMGVNTLSHHVKNLYPKLAANSRTEAVCHALREGIIRLDP